MVKKIVNLTGCFVPWQSLLMTKCPFLSKYTKLLTCLHFVLLLFQHFLLNFFDLLVVEDHLKLMDDDGMKFLIKQRLGWFFAFKRQCVYLIIEGLDA